MIAKFRGSDQNSFETTGSKSLSFENLSRINQYTSLIDRLRTEEDRMKASQEKDLRGKN